MFKNLVFLFFSYLFSFLHKTAVFLCQLLSLTVLIIHLVSIPDTTTFKQDCYDVAIMMITVLLMLLPY